MPPVYQRSILTDLAIVLADQRARCSSEAQLTVLDDLLGALCDEFHDLPGFDPDRFARTAHRWWGRTGTTDTTQDTRR